MEKWNWMALGVRQVLVFRACTYSNWWPFFIFWHSFPLIFQVSRRRCQWQWLGRRQCRWRRWSARRKLEYRIWKTRGRRREVWRIQVPEKGWCFQSKVYGALRILKETNPDILPVYSNPKQKPVQQQTERPKDVAEFICQEPGCGKICASSAGLKNHARKHCRDGRQTTATH